jgi:hypothetical protein
MAQEKDKLHWDPFGKKIESFKRRALKDAICVPTQFPSEHLDKHKIPRCRSTEDEYTRKKQKFHDQNVQAKGTIDTGNHQGNIVSRDFVVNVLELPKANFKLLSEEGKQGTFDTTGNKFVPEPTIYLTPDFEDAEGENIL